MKNILITITALLLFVSCNEDWVTRIPTESVAPETVLDNTDNGKIAINGIAKLMVIRYWSTQGYNGEGTIKNWISNYNSNNFGKNQSGWRSYLTFDFPTNPNSTLTTYTWYYYYRIISNANKILDAYETMKGPDADRKTIRAQALTYRAYCYLMLSQIYSKRWIDSNNGSADGVVLRLTASTSAENPDEIPLSTLAEVYTSIYKDLDEAIELFVEAKTKRAQIYELDASVAHAIYARAALTREDWSTAATMAAKARKGYPLMSTSEMMGGFHTPNQEWIWGSYGGPEESMAYYSYQAYLAYNANTTVVRSYPIYVSKTLYDKIPTTDIRKQWWVGPPADKPEATGTILDNTIKENIYAKYPELKANGSSLIYYMHFKIGCFAQPGIGYLNHFRSSEMYLIEAEALARQGDKDNDAQKVMNEFNRDSGRDPNYECTKIGEDLINEIILYREIELWGEGFEWFDMKRTKKPLDRKSVVDGGNFAEYLDVKRDVDYANGWCWAIPLRETDFNPEI